MTYISTLSYLQEGLFLGGDVGQVGKPIFCDEAYREKLEKALVKLLERMIYPSL